VSAPLAGRTTSRRRYTLLRRGVQSGFAVLFVWAALGGGSRLTGSAIALRAGPVELLEPASVASAIAASRGAGLDGVGVAVGLLPFVALTFALGSVYCGWICPFGLLSEALDRLRHGRAARWAGSPWERARRPRLVALALVLAASAAAALPLAALVAPPRLLSVLPAEARVLRGLPALTLALLAVALAVDGLVSRRVVCRVLCPVGAVSSLLRARAGWRPRHDRARCTCPAQPACLASCRWGIDPRHMRPRDGCTGCLACVERCPSGALSVLRRHAS
jgi:ferredoxin-type protein NapH